MVVSTVTALSPPAGVILPDPGILRPRVLVAWTGGTGPFDVQVQFDDDPAFGSPLLDNTDLGVTSPHGYTATTDLGLPGPWYWRARVRDSTTVWSDWLPAREIAYWDPIEADRALYLLASVGVAFEPTDVTTPGPADDDFAADGHTIEFDRALYLLAAVGVGFDPTDGTTWGPDGGPGDGETETFNRYLYLLANITSDTPTPHIWYVFPTFGREGWEFQVVGYGFGDTQAEYVGGVTLNGLAVSIISWELVAASGIDRAIDPAVNLAEPIHQLIRATVPSGGSSGLIVVCTDGP